jgi:hypothetical protein
MKQCYVIFFMDGDVSHVTLDPIEQWAEAHGMNVIWGRGDGGQLCRKDGSIPCRSFVGTTVE